MKFEKLQPGTVAYTVSRYTMGNTTMKSTAIHTVRVISVDAEKRTVEASWNHNAPKRFYECQTRKWKEKKPVTIEGAFGRCRLATRAEIKAMKLASDKS